MTSTRGFLKTGLYFWVKPSTTIFELVIAHSCSSRPRIRTRTYSFNKFSRGIVTSGLAIYDTMQYTQAGRGDHLHRAGGVHGSLLLTAGAKGKRSTLPNSRI